MVKKHDSYLGPLLYHYEGMADETSIEFTFEELKVILSTFNFEIQVKF